jgi:hypothetical protein
MEDSLEDLKKRDGIATADLDAHREQRAATTLSQYTPSLASTTSVESISYLSPEKNREYGNRDCTYPK